MGIWQSVGAHGYIVQWLKAIALRPVWQRSLAFAGGL
jgi:hypothetical protein